MPASPPHPVTRLTVLAVAMFLLAQVTVVGADAGGEGPGRANGLYTEPGLEYVVVAPTHLARYLAPLVEWKMDRGVPAQVFNWEQIEGVYPGRDGAERLHNFLQDLYHNHTGGTPKWLLLAGDTDLVPVRYLWADRDHTGNTRAERNLYVGDTYYSGLDSDWDVDGDDVFGEPGEEDLLPELFVGRISASLPEEMEAAVAKVLSYELDPPTGDWYGNAFLAGALMDEPNRLDDPYTLPGTSGSSDEGFDPYTDNAYEVTQKVRAILGEGYDYVDLADYPFFEGGRYNASVDTLNRVAAAAAWERGNAFVFWASHGYEAFGGLAEYQGTGTSGMFESAYPFIVNQDTLVNTTAGMLPLVYVSSCYAGQFDKPASTNFERMLTVPEGGAIALIAGDGDTFRLENISHRSFGNWWLGERFFRLVIDEGLVRPGEALYTLKSEYHTYYLTEGPPASDEIDMDYFYSNLYAYNLQGDPEVPVWVGEPDRLELQVLSGAAFNAPSTRVRVVDAGTGEPVEGATVHARGAGLDGLLEFATDASGMAEVSPGPKVMGGELRLAVTKDNWVSDRRVITVGEGVSDLRLTDADLVGPSEALLTGEPVSFVATVSNAGDFPLSDLTVHFDSGDLAAPENGGVDARNQTRSVALSAGESVDLEFLHRYSSPGDYDVMALVDPDDQVVEVSELDNEAIHHLRLFQVPGIAGSVGPFRLDVGEVLAEPIDLTSHISGDVTGIDAVGFRLSQVPADVDAWIDEGDRLVVRTSEGPDRLTALVVEMTYEGVPVAEMDVLLSVRDVNAPPVVVAVPDQVVSLGDTLVLEVNATDPEGDTLRFTSSLEGTLFEGPVMTWRPKTDDVGVQFPTVSVWDSDHSSTMVRFRLTVEAENAVPFIQDLEDEVEVDRGEVAHFTVSAVDADGDELTYHLASPDEGFSIDRATGLLTFSAEGLDPGTYRATVVVTDGQDSAERAVTVTVDGSATVPVLWLLLAGALMLVVVLLLFSYRK